jgi:hypothetical protein
VAETKNRPSRRTTTGVALALCAAILSSSAFAAGIDSRAYTCTGLQSLIAQHGFVFISQATFGDFAVANRSVCSGGDPVVERRSVATSDNPECIINYCVSREPQNGGGDRQ